MSDGITGIKVTDSVITESSRSETESNTLGDDTAVIEQLSIQLLEQTERNSNMEMELMSMKRQIQELRRQLIESRKAKEESDKEVEKLSYEMEDLSATLFDEANIKVKEANVLANEYVLRNEKLVETLKEKDLSIELLNNELKNLKDVIGDLAEENSRYAKMSSSVESSTRPDALFQSRQLNKFNSKVIYSPTYNQLRFDLHDFNEFKDALSSTSTVFNIKETPFYKTLLLEDIEPVIRLNFSPTIKFYQKKTFIHNLQEHKVTIEPLSASTEVWKASQLSLSAPSSVPSSPALSQTNTDVVSEKNVDLKMFKYETDQPVAVESRCAVCGEARKHMNFARLYKMKVKQLEYLLCISCSLKLRRILDLFNYLKTLQPTKDLEQILKNWCEVVELRVKLYYCKLGLWDDSDENGLVYGWKNSWIGNIAFTDQTSTNVELASDVASESGSKKEEPSDDVDDTGFIDTEVISKNENDSTVIQEGYNASPKLDKSNDILNDYLDGYSRGSSGEEEDEFNDAEEDQK